MIKTYFINLSATPFTIKGLHTYIKILINLQLNMDNFATIFILCLKYFEGVEIYDRVLFTNLF